MAVRLGIELSPVACRIVALEPARFERGRPETRVTFATMARSGRATEDALALVRGQRAAVVVWAAGADHRQVVVADRSYEHMRAEARAALRAAGRQAGQALADIAPIPGSMADERRTVLLASAGAAEVAVMLTPLLEAGVRIDRVLTPAAALLSLARARRSTAAKAAQLEAYVAIDECVGCLALIRDGGLLGAIDLPWGHVEEIGGRRALRARDDVAERLADDLTVFMDDCRLDRDALGRVYICGGVPELRSMSMALMEWLDVEVEPLDSLFGVDASRLPGDSGEFRERMAALRLAWAAAADPRPPIDLFRLRRRSAWGARLARVAVAAGSAAGLMLGWDIQQRWPPVTPAPAVETAPMLTRLPGDGALTPTSDTRSVAATRPAATTPSRIISRPLFRTVREPVPVPSAPGDPTSTSKVKPSRPAASARRQTEPDRSARVEQARLVAFDATLDSILFGPNRRLALVDGRIVEAGDVVKGATIVDITTEGVVLRDDRGQLRYLAP